MTAVFPENEQAADTGSPRSAAPPAGWYPTGAGRLRWWDGEQWTAFEASADSQKIPLPARHRWLRRLGFALLAPIVVGPILLFLSVYGDPYPEARAGVRRSVAGLEIVNAVCPGERLKRITLRRAPSTDSEVWPEVWAIEGDAPLEARIPVGAEVDSMTTATPMVISLEEDLRLSLRVETNELPSPYSLDFVVSEVPINGVLTHDGIFESAAAFENTARRLTPCDDNDALSGPQRASLWIMLMAIPLTIASIVIFVWTTPRSP